ncbi:winged helix-turn-helix transcriptional regulator [Candidatus Poribacteria bacterium]|jgi:hypothetical protein|nr:winged helix-turn-helix transcriptional regulator [Candidatus Poribacteria bacterium]MBT5534110.1 winged helix-turn-helix transcriptional regulator [Candidatus Poribacteria bacterium]MBT5713637.1 winged helix-turn-helix transcriptional regulator [Candidatus Poribacteria bacterium]MBT7101656.1 winged helix-turn-helix transcriptional regulator [Candidatus Poribacteria bacterium]MBT7806856.1 winged helix-turn-helix transcriptional regulator [Candidatus Poribacteria bacterium]
MRAGTDHGDGGIDELREAISGIIARLEAVEGSTGGKKQESGAPPTIAVTKLKGFCVEGGRIFTHETGYCGKGTLSADRSVLYVPTPAVEANRELPAEETERLFTPLGNRQRVVLLRALSHDAPTGSGALRDATGLTEGQFYHHMGELYAQGYTSKSGQDRYQLSDKGKVMLVVAEALAADLGSAR